MTNISINLNKVTQYSKDSTIRNFYIYRIVSRLSFYIPILVIYFLSTKMNLIQIAILIATYNLMTTIFSTPISTIVRQFGPRKVLVIGEILKGTSVGMIYFSLNISDTIGVSHFIVILIAQLFGGIGYSACASSDSSFLFTYCKSAGKEDEYKTHESKSASFLFLSFLSAGVIGGFVSIIDIKLPFLLTFPAHLICAVLAFSFPDIKLLSENKEKTKRNILIEFDNPQLIVNLLFYSVSRALVMTLSIAILPIYFFVNLNISIALFGVIFGCYTLTSFFMGKSTIKIREKIGEKKFGILLIGFMLISISLLYFTHSYIALIAPIFLYAVAGAIRPHSLTRVNAAIKHDENRSTIISMAEAIFGLLNILMVLGCFVYLATHNIYDVFGILLITAATLYSLLFVISKGRV